MIRFAVNDAARFWCQGYDRRRNHPIFNNINLRSALRRQYDPVSKQEVLTLRKIATIIALIAGLGASGAAIAANPGGSAQISKVRYTMTPTDGGFIRMDTETGILSFCSSKSGAMRCELVPDDRAALTKEIAQLKKELKELRDDNKRLEDMVLGNDKKSGNDKSRKRSFKFPSEEEVDKALGYVERMYKKFRDKLRELESESGKGKGTDL